RTYGDMATYRYCPLRVGQNDRPLVSRLTIIGMLTDSSGRIPTRRKVNASITIQASRYGRELLGRLSGSRLRVFPTVRSSLPEFRLWGRQSSEPSLIYLRNLTAGHVGGRGFDLRRFSQ